MERRHRRRAPFVYGSAHLSPTVFGALAETYNVDFGRQQQMGPRVLVIFVHMDCQLQWHGDGIALLRANDSFSGIGPSFSQSSIAIRASCKNNCEAHVLRRD